MVARFQINLAKELVSLMLVEEVINSRDWVPISDYDFVKVFVINTESPCLVFLLHQPDWTSARRSAWSDVSFLD